MSHSMNTKIEFIDQSSIDWTHNLSIYQDPTSNSAKICLCCKWSTLLWAPGREAMLFSTFLFPSDIWIWFRFDLNSQLFRN